MAAHIRQQEYRTLLYRLYRHRVMLRQLHWSFMAKFKPAGGKKLPAKSARSAIPCLIIVILGIVIMCLLFYFSLQSSTS
jgi:hypothetical protein